MKLPLQAEPRIDWLMGGAGLLTELVSFSRNEMAVLGSSPLISLPQALIGLCTWSPRETMAVLWFMLQDSRWVRLK